VTCIVANSEGELDRERFESLEIAGTEPQRARG
jgi:hypothetical protein